MPDSEIPVTGTPHVRTRNTDGGVDVLHDAEGRRYHLRTAVMNDLDVIVTLLSDDVLGATRERSDLTKYITAFNAIDRDLNQRLVVVSDADDRISATMQLTLIPGLSRGGSTRLQIEAVRVAAFARGAGLGHALFAWACEYGRAHGAALAQLTTDRTRVDAHRFYEQTGFEHTHHGYKRAL